MVMWLPLVPGVLALPGETCNIGREGKCRHISSLGEKRFPQSNKIHCKTNCQYYIYLSDLYLDITLFLAAVIDFQ